MSFNLKNEKYHLKNDKKWSCITGITFNLSSLKIVAFNVEAKTAACSSNRGIVNILFLTGANLLFFKIKLQYMTSGLDMRKYETVPSWDFNTF